MAYTGHIMTLANSIIGVGILAMPFCFQKCGIILSIVLLILSNLVTRISCHYLLKSSLLTRRKSFEFLAFHAFGPPGKLLVELCIIGYLIGTCITYFVVVGDLGPQIAAKVFNVSESDNLRTWVMIVVTILCIIPLGLLKNVDSLAAVCTASVGFYFCLVVKVMFEARTHIFNADWIEHVDFWKPSGILQCLPIFSMALSCQMQLFEVLDSINAASLEKLNEVVRMATTICTCVYIFVGFFGYVAFCNQQFSGNILVNFSPSFVSDAIKVGFVLSVAFSFPLAIFPCRASIYSLLYRRGHSDSSGYMPENRFKCITISIVLLALLLGLLIPSIELVIGLVGSTIGIVICILFPASCFMKIFKKDSTEKLLAQLIFVCGFCLMIFGTYANLNAIDEKRSGPPAMEFAKTPAPVEVFNANKIIDGDIKVANKIVVLPDSVLKDSDKRSKFRERIDTMPKSERVDPLPKDNIVKKFEPTPVPKIENPQENVKLSANDAKKGGQEGVEVNIEPKLEKNLPTEKPKETNIEINRDAIKKEDEAEAEEDKKKENIEEIKKAEKELKQTKELLEKRVIELKEELAKQNQETQNLVVEKLGDIADKVDELERKVHSETDKNKDKLADSLVATESATINVKESKVAEAKVAEVPLSDTKLSEKGPILTMLTDNLQKIAAASSLKNVPPNSSVYEPMSYKVGEVMNQESNQPVPVEKKAPLPLPLLLNATVHKNADAAIAPREEIKPVVREENQKNSNAEKKKDEPDSDRENIESIRRDILAAVTNKDDSTLAANNLREKRNAEFCINWDLEQKNCLDDGIISKLLPKIGAEIIVQSSFGRDLKSVTEKS